MFLLDLCLKKAGGRGVTDYTFWAKSDEDSDAYSLRHMKLHKRNDVHVQTYCETTRL